MKGVCVLLQLPGSKDVEMIPSVLLEASCNISIVCSSLETSYIKFTKNSNLEI